MYPKFTFIRHAQSLHNEKTKEVIAKLPNDANYKQSHLYKAFKYSEELLDAPLTEIGRKQLLQTKKKIKYEEIDTVIVSPLRRALESCDILFSSRQDIKIYVEPLLCEWITSACDIGSNISQSRQLYSHRFNFQKISEVNEDLWYINHILSEEKQKTVLQNLNLSQNQQRQAKNNKIVHKVTLNQLRNSQNLEDLNQLKNRALKLKKQLANFKRNSFKKIALIGHGGIFRALTATGFHENGEPINSVGLDNGECKQIPIIIEGESFEQQNFVPFCSF